jgi:hypothetical protein
VTGIVVALAGTGAPVEAATSTPAGVGTTQVTSKLVDLNIAAGLLDVSVFTDQGTTNTDAKAGQTLAKNTLTPLSLTSNQVDLSPITSLLSAVTAPESAESPGANPSVNKSLVNFSSGPAAPVISGQLNPVTLTTALDAAKGATSGLTAALTNLKVLSGIAGIATLTNNDALAAAPTAASGARQFKIGSIPILNLGALLQGLGINLAQLPVSAVTSLVDQLKLGVPSLGGNNTTLTDATNTLLGLMGLKTQADSAKSSSSTITVAAPLAQVINSLDKSAKLSSNGQDVTASDLQTILGTVQTNLNASSFADLLSSLLSGGLANLLKTPLLEVDTGALQVVTKAAATVADSAADVTAGIPSLKVLGMNVPGIDTLVSTLQTVLGMINQNLVGLLSVTLLDKSRNITQANGYTNAVAQASEFKLTIDPSKVGLSSVKASLPAVTDSLPTGGSIDLGNTAIKTLAPSLQLPANPFASLFNARILAAGPLALGATTLSLGQVNSESKFTLVPATPAAPAQPTSTLPRTGREMGPWAAMAAVLLALSLGARRWLGRVRASA